jgi:hypothetical protein
MQIIDTDVEICKDRAEKTYPELIPIIDWFANNRDLIESDEDIKVLGLIKNGEIVVPCPASWKN